MIKWKTSQRKSKKLPTSESGGNLSEYSYGEPASDSSSLSFLDDMLGTSTGASRPQARQQEARRNNGARTPPPPQMKIGDIDDLLGLVSGPDEERRRDSSSSGLSSRSNRGHERREPESTSTYEPIQTRSSMRPLSRYRSGGSARPGSRDHSPEPPTFPTESDNTYYRSGRGPPTSDKSGRRKSGSRDSSLDPSARPNLFNTKRSERSRSPHPDADDYVDDDNLMPIPVFQVNTDEDDTISCITTSVSSHYDVESRSGSFPWSRRGLKSVSVGEHSHADTLDEIADLLHPNQNGRSTGLTPRAGGNFKTPAASNEFFRPPPPKQLTSVDDVFGSNPHFAQSDAPPLNAQEIYRGTKAPKLRSRRSWVSYGEPFLSQTRLLFRYWISRILPHQWRKKGGKNDDGQGYLGTWNSGSDPKVPRSKQRRASLNSVPFCVGRVVVVLFVTSLLGRLGMLHGAKIKSSAMAKIRAATKKRATKPPVGKDVYGGMAKRSDSSSVGGRFRGSVSGGMAHHSEVDLNSAPMKHDNSHHDHAGVELPAAFQVLADVTDLPVRKGVDAPFYWHIPRSGGGTVNDIFGGCLSLTLASDAGGSGAAGLENVSVSILCTDVGFSCSITNIPP